MVLFFADLVVGEEDETVAPQSSYVKPLQIKSCFAKPASSQNFNRAESSCPSPSSGLKKVQKWQKALAGTFPLFIPS